MPVATKPQQSENDIAEEAGTRSSYRIKKNAQRQANLKRERELGVF